MHLKSHQKTTSIIIIIINYFVVIYSPMILCTYATCTYTYMYLFKHHALDHQLYIIMYILCS